MFDSNIMFALPITCEDLDYYSTDDDETEISND